MPPGESPPEKTAPEPLELVQRFVNSIDLEDGEDELASPQALRDWLAERDLMVPRERAAPPTCAGRSTCVRACARCSCGTTACRSTRTRSSASTGRRPGPASASSFRAGASPRSAAGAAWTARSRGCWRSSATAVADGSWERLKACPREDCEWAFYDRSKNRSGRWCRMEECGNLAKAGPSASAARGHSTV